MGSQLFYTYTSTELPTTSYLQQSIDAIVDNNTYTYSLVFDTKRRTIWAQDREYGGTTKISSKDYQEDVSVIQSGIPVQTYNGQISYFYVNKNGELSVFDSVKIASFDVYIGDDCVTGQHLVPQTITGSDYIDKFKFTLTGTDAANSQLTTVKLTSNISFGTTQSNYPSTSGTTVDYNTGINPYVYDNDGCQYNGTSGERLEMTLFVQDRLGNTDEKTILVAEFMHMIYYGTATIEQIQNNGFSSLATVSTQPFGNIGSFEEMETIVGSDYFWVLIPDTQDVHTCKMYQGGGEAEWHPDYNGVVINGYKAYRTPKKNISGAEYYVKIN